MGDSVKLVGPQPYLRVNASKGDMASVIFSKTGGIEQLIIFLYQRLPALRVTPYPVPESVFDGLLFLLGQGGFFLVQDAALFAVRIFNGVINADIPEV